jgi:hypothetical protein
MRKAAERGPGVGSGTLDVDFLINTWLPCRRGCVVGMRNRVGGDQPYREIYTHTATEIEVMSIIKIVITW